MALNSFYISKIHEKSDTFIDLTAFDHIEGFNEEYKNQTFEYLTDKYENVVLRSEYIFDSRIAQKYPSMKFIFDIKTHIKHLGKLKDYNVHPDLKFKNFLCSFNGSDHVSRQLLTAILNNQGYFDSDYCSKNFTYSDDKVTSQLDNLNLTDLQVRLYRKFFSNSTLFNDSVYSFGHVRYDHATNIYNLEYKLTDSFLNLVSETMATSYYPFFTEKFLYSVVTRGLFVVYAHPFWHSHLEKYYGFKKYDKIFDYSFDRIENPVKRLVALIEMISKFKSLSTDDWCDLYHMELDTIEYNYDHYFSGKYLKCLSHY